MDGGFDFNFLFASEGNASQSDAQGNGNAATITLSNALTGVQDTDGAAAASTTDGLTDVEQGFDFFLDAFAQSTDTVTAPVAAHETTTHVPAEHDAVSVRVEEKQKDVSTALVRETSVCEITAADITSVQPESKTTVPQAEANKETNVTVADVTTSVHIEQPPLPAEAKPPTVPRSTQVEPCTNEQEPLHAIVKSPQQTRALPSLPIASSTTVITKTNPSTVNASVSVDELTAQVKQLMQSVAPLVQDDAAVVNNNEENDSAADGATTSDAEFAQMAGQLLRHAAQSRTEAARVAAQLQMKAVALMEMLGPHAGLASILGKEYASTPVTNLILLLIPLLQELLRE